MDPPVEQRAASLLNLLLYYGSDPVLSGVRGLISELKSEQHSLPLQYCSNSPCREKEKITIFKINSCLLGLQNIVACYLKSMFSFIKGWVFYLMIYQSNTEYSKTLFLLIFTTEVNMPLDSVILCSRTLVSFIAHHAHLISRT